MSNAAKQAQAALRSQILHGDLPGDMRVTESSAAASLGLSRTPVRAALSALEGEGLLIKLPGRGYSVRSFRQEDMAKAAQVRSVLEGLAASRVAAQGPSAEVVAAIEGSLHTSSILINKTTLGSEDFKAYQGANEVFHQTLIQACNNPFVGLGLEKIQGIPIVAPGAFSEMEGTAEAKAQRLFVGHSQHVVIWDAIKSGDAIRAENMMREHALAPVRYAELFLGGSQ